MEKYYSGRMDDCWVEMKAELSAAEWADNSAVRRDVLMVL